jgi:putative ABC transport system ATP-binding protein
MSVIIKTKNISKDFAIGKNLQRVLFDINLEINEGELTMLVGPSGCGKTTLISILSGILSASEGEVDVLGVKINEISDNEKTNFRLQNLGFIFQQYNLLPALTAAENAAIPLIASGENFQEAIKKSSQILAEIGMSGQENKKPSQLSGGQQQRVAIARALVHEPKIIICDEPTAALDAKTGQKVMEILKTHALKQGRAVLVVTHDNRIFDFANRIIEMEDGKIINDKKNE